LANGERAEHLALALGPLAECFLNGYHGVTLVALSRLRFGCFG
jgi:hypothetical protein